MSLSRVETKSHVSFEIRFRSILETKNKDGIAFSDNSVEIDKVSSEILCAARCDIEFGLQAMVEERKE